MSAYYNEIDPFAAQWLRNLISAGRIAPGDVDERSIVDVRPSDLAGYSQCHFFAGIGGWSLALRLAGWPDDRPVWTGSCPCQPFSAAGKQGGFDDARHLWPVWFSLIRERRPAVIFGEQVASPIAIGRAHPVVPEMRDREAVFTVLQEFQGQSAALVHGVRLLGGAFPQAGEPQGNVEAAEEVEGCPSRQCVSERRASSSANARSAVHTGPGGYSGEDRGRGLRTHRNTIRPDSAEGVERSLFGPDRAGGGVHIHKCPGCPLRAECDGEHVGTGQDCRDCECDFGEAPGEIERIAGWLSRETKRAVERAWIDDVHSDLAGIDYSLGAVDLPAAGVGAPHIRQRLGFVADAGRLGGEPDRLDLGKPSRGAEGEGDQRQRLWSDGRDGGAVGGMGLPDRTGPSAGRQAAALDGYGYPAFATGGRDAAGPLHVDWRDADWLLCRDGRWRPVEPGSQPLAHGVPGRVGRLRAYGNAIVPALWAELIGAYLDLEQARAA